MFKAKILGQRRFLWRGREKPAYARYRQKTGWIVVLTGLATLALFLMVSGSVLALVGFAVFAKDLPKPDRLTNRKVNVSTRLLDRNGKILYEIYRDVNRNIVKLGDLPQDLIDATLAVEDADFYKHQGFDVLSIARALRNNLLFRDVQGGSTITQQLVKTALLSRERTVTRKIKELILSIQIERLYNKDQILQIYYNEAPYGGTAWGIGAASEFYFGKKTSELKLAEAALLAGLPQAPTVYSPFGKTPEKARERQRYVIHLMETRGWLSKDGQRHFLSKGEAEKARKEPLVYAKAGQTIKAPHFSLYVRRLLEQRYGVDLVESGGLQVVTSLDLTLQEKLEKIVFDELEKIKVLKVGNGALVAMDPKTGEILSLVGSKDYFDQKNQGNFNVAVDGWRQPGSAIKPITYAIVFSRGLTPATLIMDVPSQFPGGADSPIYAPVNYDGRFRGPLSLREALGNSINVPAVKLLKIVGLGSFIDAAQALGVTTLTDPRRYGLSLTLGGGSVPLLQMVAAYGALANGGLRVEPTAILEVRDVKGKVLEALAPGGERSATRVFTPPASYLVSHILSDNGARAQVFGTGSLLNIPGFSVAAKTGTSNDKRDNWAIGYTPSVVIGVWVGNNDNSPMDSKLASGITGATPVWNKSMKEFLKGKKNEPLVRPEGIVEMEVDALTGMLPFEGRPTKAEIFIAGTQPQTVSDMYQRIKVCRSDQKIANQSCLDRGDYDEKVFVKFHDPASRDEFQDDIDKFLNETDGFKDKEEYHPPTETTPS